MGGEVGLVIVARAENIVTDSGLDETACASNKRHDSCQ